MVEMLGLKKPLPMMTQRERREHQQDEELAALAAAGVLALGDAPRQDAAVAADKGDRAIVLALDLEALVARDDILGALFAVAHHLHFIALAAGFEEGLGRRAVEAEAEIADRHQQRAELHRSLRAEITVGEQAAEQRGQVNQAGEGAIKPVGDIVAEQEMVGKEQRQQRAHAVIAEAFPHFGGEQAGELGRVAEPLRTRVLERNIARGLRRGGSVTQNPNSQTPDPALWPIMGATIAAHCRRRKGQLGATLHNIVRRAT